MELVIVHTKLFKVMQSTPVLEVTERERKQMKYSFIDRIKDTVQRRWDKAKKLTGVIDEIIFKATDRGYSFNGKETLAELCKCSISTVEEALRVLKESGEAVICYRENPNSNGYKTPVVILKKHPHFHYWSELLGLEKEVVQEVEQGVEKAEIPCESKEKTSKKISTYSLSLKQESNKYISNSKIVQFVVNRVQDSINKGGTVQYLSSYIDKIVSSLEKQSLYAENNRIKAMNKQRKVESSSMYKEIFGDTKPPIYNWLE
jgi:hypothetical protein